MSDYSFFSKILHYKSKQEQCKSTKEYFILANALQFIKEQENVTFKNFHRIDSPSKPDFVGTLHDTIDKKVYVELTDTEQLPTKF